jgi:replication-associated recombination protein RarA
MTELVLNPVTRQQLADFTATPSHAVILVGPTGSGKNTLAIKLAEAILGLKAGSFQDHPYQIVIASEDGKAIGIEAVRELEHFLSLKVPGRSTYDRAIIIDNAQLLTTEAQNALLKTLEEPPQGTFLVLTATSDQALLPTIRSRAQSISVKRPNSDNITDYFQAKNFDNTAIKQAYAVSGGLTGLMQALLEQTDHPLIQATEKARQLLSQSAYERLLMVDELSKQRQLALDTTFILQQMAHVSLQRASGDAAKKWQAVLGASYQASEALSANAQPKLALTKLMLSF